MNKLFKIGNQFHKMIQKYKVSKYYTCEKILNTHFQIPFNVILLTV